MFYQFLDSVSQTDLRIAQFKPARIIRDDHLGRHLATELSERDHLLN